MSPAPRNARPPRVEVNYRAVLITSDGCESEVIVKDLSRDGFRIELNDEVLVGERVYLRAGKHGDLAAEIRWTLGCQAGGVFLDGPNPPPS